MESLPNQPFYSITDAARLLGVSPTTLRRWENEGRIIPLRTIGGDRRYSPQDIQKVLTSFREETDQRRETEPENQTTRKPNNQLPPPLVPIRQLESYRPSRRGRPLRSLVILVAVLLLTFGFFNSLPQLTRTRLERALTTEPTNPIVDVNDVA
ncbi:MAG: helix-turn-helix domain-containing protein, partial [Patescibacteria group bacterium]